MSKQTISNTSMEPWIKKFIDKALSSDIEPFTTKNECLHDNCPDCRGTGIKDNGWNCIHMISCRCTKCRSVIL